MGREASSQLCLEDSTYPLRPRGLLHSEGKSELPICLDRNTYFQSPAFMLFIATKGTCDSYSSYLLNTIYW